MMTPISAFDKSIKEAKEILMRMNDNIHGVGHAEAVANYAIAIARETGINVDLELIKTAAWWHDTGRLYDNDNHEELSAEMAFDSLKRLGVAKDECQTIYDAIVFHRWSMAPLTIEGKIIRDADKLDFLSINRWKHCMKQNHRKMMRGMVEVIPKIRDEIFDFESSKRMYDSMIGEFRKFVSSHRDSFGILTI